MAISTKKPSQKMTVGAQYICFDTMDDNGSWTSTFESAVTKLPTVTEVSVSDEADSHESYASGDVYDSDTQISSIKLETTNLAFDDLLLAKMRGATTNGGIIVDGGITQRPYFAYGFVVKKKDGTLDLRWYPKCKLTENSDDSSTSEDKWSDQTDKITISAYGFNDNHDKVVRVINDQENTENVTEDKFFAKPLLSIAEVQAVSSAS